MSSRKILLVDDSALVRAVVIHSLQREGVVVASIDDPKDLAAAMTRETPELVLVDATFPGVDDDQLVAFVAPHTAVCPVVVFSDRGVATLEALAQRMNAAGVVPKEAAGGELWSRLQRYLPAN